MTLALHASGLPFVALILLSLIVAYGLIRIMGDDDRPEDTWLR